MEGRDGPSFGYLLTKFWNSDSPPYVVWYIYTGAVWIFEIQTAPRQPINCARDFQCQAHTNNACVHAYDSYKTNLAHTHGKQQCSTVKFWSVPMVRIRWASIHGSGTSFCLKILNRLSHTRLISSKIVAWILSGNSPYLIPKSRGKLYRLNPLLSLYHIWNNPNDGSLQLLSLAIVALVNSPLRPAKHGCPAPSHLSRLISAEKSRKKS